ncbi:hypothetical protein SAMN06295905_1231 [Devosia lucknowensis]|uniref:DUF6894 domain-containing protein n=1 Tax=Devosia lucknowensis TaxID=1096929 RepID=A0A1Y6ETB4_9HYPH|nr:hypothetical protein [Devosia lucknowensis]SMQ65459.1 hypothetical protein SAMN06295905_1231 [Devosia lucknowensis]
MERYFFNHRDADGHLEMDIDGIILPSLNNALDEASFAARGAVALAEQQTEGCFEIEDAGRRLVARVPYAVRDEN